jgi:hypothetical protein
LQWNSTCFGNFLCPSSGVIHCKHSNGLISHTDSFRAGSGWIPSWSSRIRMDSILIQLESSLQTCMTYTTPECAVNNSWWWTEELSEICSVSFQNKFEKLVHLVGFIIRKIVYTVYPHFHIPLYIKTETKNNSAKKNKDSPLFNSLFFSG